MTTFIDHLRNAVANLGEDGFNDELTELTHPLEPHWRGLDVNVRAELRTKWRNRLRRDFDHALNVALEEAAKGSACTCGDQRGTYSRHAGNPDGHASTCPQWGGR